VGGSVQLQQFGGQLGLIAGGSRGIGYAIARQFAQAGGIPILVARNSATLQQAALALKGEYQTPVHTCTADLGTAAGIDAAYRAVAAAGDRLALLACSAGEFRFEADFPDLAAQAATFATNAIGPYRLARTLLPALERAGGHVVFINSSIVLREGAEAATYAASKHALRAYANALRGEVNTKGIRVLSVFLGRTATRMQEKIMEREGKTYVPEQLLQPDEVARSVLAAVSLSAQSEVTEIFLRPGRLH
jgi:short-subunit dehydrogenase